MTSQKTKISPAALLWKAKTGQMYQYCVVYQRYVLFQKACSFWDNLENDQKTRTTAPVIVIFGNLVYFWLYFWQSSANFHYLKKITFLWIILILTKMWCWTAPRFGQFWSLFGTFLALFDQKWAKMSSIFRKF